MQSSDSTEQQDALEIQWDRWYRDISSSSPKSRVGVLLQIINELPKDISGNAEKEELYSDEVVELLFSTLLLYDRSSGGKSTSLVEKAIVTWSKLSSHFVAKFATKWTKQAISLSKAPSSTSLTPLLRLFRWSCRLLQCKENLNPLFKENAASPLFSTFVSQQAVLLSAISTSSNETLGQKLIETRKAEQLFLQTLKTNETLFNIYMLVLSKQEIGQQHGKLIGLISDYCSKNPAHLEQHKAKLLEYYCKIVLGATSKAPVSIVKAFKSLLKSLTEDDIKNGLLSTLSRVMKRGPELVMQSIAYTFEFFSTDLSKLAPEVFSLIQPHLKATNENLRSESIDAIKALMSHIHDPTTLDKLSKDIIKLLKEKIPQIYERISILGVIDALHSAPVDTKTDLATIVINSVFDFLEVEGNEEVKATAFNVVNTYLRYVPSLPAAKYQKLYTSAIQTDKDNIKHSALESLFVLLQSPTSDKIAQVKSLLPAIVKLIQSNRLTSDLIYVARVLLTLSRLDSSFDWKQHWTSISRDDLAIFKDSFLNKLKDRDFIAMASLCEHLISHKVVAYDSLEFKAVCSALVATLLQKQTNVRKYAAAATKRAHTANEHLADGLVHALLNIVIENKSPFLANKHELPSAIAVLASPTLNPANLGVLLLVASYPLSRSEGFSSWKVALKEVKKDVSELITSNISSIVSYLLSESGLKHELHSIQEAAVSSLVVLTSNFPKQSLPVIVPQLLSLIQTDQQQLYSLTPTEIGIYKTPEGELYDKGSQYEFKPTVVESKQTAQRERKKRGERGMYSAEDAEWEEKLRKELEKKKGGKEETKDPEQKAKEEKLQKEQVVRDKVTKIVNQVLSEIEVISALAKGKPSAVHDYLYLIMPALVCFMEAPLIGDNTTHVIESLYVTLPPVLQPQARRLAYVVTVSVRALTGQFNDDSTLASLLDSTLAELVKVTEDPLPANTFAFCYPVCKLGIIKSYTFSIQENALNFIEQHTPVALSYPRSQMIGSLTRLLQVTEATSIQNRCVQCMLHLAAGLEVPKGEELQRLSELIDGLLIPEPIVRNSCLQALATVPALKSSTLGANDFVAARLFTSKFDTDGDNAALGAQVWSLYSQNLPRNFWSLFSGILCTSQRPVQTIIGAALSGAIQIYPDSLDEIIQNLFNLYKEKRPTDTRSDPHVKSRLGVAVGLGGIAPALTVEKILPIFEFLLNIGLMDNDDSVRQAFEQAGLDIINQQGAQVSSTLLDVFEEYLKKPSENTAQDRVRESVVIFMGTLARHLGANNPKLLVIVDQLIEILRTPSESVQKAVSKCLIPLMPLIKDSGKAEGLIALLLDRLQNGQSYADRRGAAYGIAGFVKGFGISSLKNFNIMNVLQEAVEDKKHPNARQGALFAFECLCNTLERLFEPYVIQILPKLLVCYGDSVNDVREATVDASKSIMSQLSAHGVKLVLPALLKALEDRSWRTKTGSINLIGSMAFCAPKQLSACLPTIVPRLSVVLTDTHAKVQEAAREALGHIGSVIRNPEIQLHVPILLKAIDDPDLHSKEALEALIHTNFVHTIDAPSLSLIMPILHRGLKERVTETKKRSAQIVGNMCSLTDHKDLQPYLDMLITDLKGAIIDPIPEVRAISARALGSLIKGLGESLFPGIMQWFLDTMKSDAGAVERSGAAQGLSEAVAGLPISRLEGLLPEILANANHVKPIIREGYIGLFIFLPSAIGSKFQPYLPQVLPLILQGLADEVEAVRDVSMRAGQAIVNQYASSALPLLLPALEDGLFHDNWRIRQSSVQLLGELLYQVLGTKEVQEGEDTGNTISKALGQDRRNSILAALYLIRSDVSSVVRQKALMVWKSVVGNTPKTLREILPTLMRMLITCLGSSNYDKRQVGSKTLGELVAKLGDKILPEIIPIMEAGLDSDNPDTKQGVCLGLSEVMGSTPKAQLDTYMQVLIPLVRKALCDELPEVRETAAQAFDMLYKNSGNKALDDILPPLLEQLSDETSHALDGLRQILTVRSSVVLPFLVPKLLTPPITTFNVRALASIAQVAGPALNQHLSTLVPAIVQAIVLETDNVQEVRSGAETIVLAVQPDGYHTLALELIKALESTDSKARIEASSLIGSWCANTKSNTNLESELNLILDALLQRFNDDVKEVQSAAWGALGNVTGILKKENINSYVPYMKNVLEGIKEELQKKKQNVLPGFCLPKGLSPVLPMFLNGLMLGSADVREVSAKGLGDLIVLTSEDALKPFVIQITGPLIRIIGDRFPWQVKAAILQTLNLLIGKGGIMLKPFLPQLQTTFIKALQDPSRGVRAYAATALGSLMTLNTKVDPLLTELLNGATNAEAEIQETMLTALHEVLVKSGKNASADTLVKLRATLFNIFSSDIESIRNLAAQCTGTILFLYNEKDVAGALQSMTDQQTWQIKQSTCLALKTLLKEKPSIFSSIEKETVSFLLDCLQNDKPQVRASACGTLGKILMITEFAESSAVLSILTPLSQAMDDPVNDVKLVALQSVKNFAKHNPKVMTKHLGIIVPILMERIKDRTNFPVKLAAERALLHSLQIHTNPETIKIYTQTIDQTTARLLVDYAKRVLSKLQQQSDSEEDQPKPDTE